MLVHDTAIQLSTHVKNTWPSLSFDAESVAFGAASHDIGKARIVEELSRPGKLHEEVGERLLLEHGVPASMARFARTHGAELAGLQLEDMLVVLADTCWKGKRDKALDDAVVRVLTAASGVAAWDAFLKLDDILTALARDADKRLEFQALFAV